MLNLQQILRPTTIEEAVQLLHRPGTVPLARGTALIAGHRRDVQAAVDLSGLSLAYIRESAGGIAIGATTTLAELEESPMLRAVANGVLARAAHRSAASILRNQVTAAGTLITEPDGIFAVALLALDAQITILRQDTDTVALSDFLSTREQWLNQALLTQIEIPLTNPRAAIETVARTPSDKPIVGVCAAAKFEDGRVREVRIALGGVGETALRATAAEKTPEGQALTDSAIQRAVEAIGVSSLSPRGDYRGSAEYRREMARVLTSRVLQDLKTG